MDNRERIIRLWFDMWLTKKDLGISDIFSNNAIYIESWGPEYHGIKKINFGLRNGIPGEPSYNGTSNSFSIKTIRLSLNGILRIKWTTVM